MVRGGPTPLQGFSSLCSLWQTRNSRKTPFRAIFQPRTHTAGQRGMPRAGPPRQEAECGNHQQAVRRQMSETLITPQLKPPLNAAPTPASQPAGRRAAPGPAAPQGLTWRRRQCVGGAPFRAGSGGNTAPRNERSAARTFRLLPPPRGLLWGFGRTWHARRRADTRRRAGRGLSAWP